MLWPLSHGSPQPPRQLHSSFKGDRQPHIQTDAQRVYRVGFGKLFPQKITYYSILLFSDIDAQGVYQVARLWQIIPPKSPIILYILLFSDIEPIILSKVAHYSQIILNSEHIVCSIKLRVI